MNQFQSDDQIGREMFKKEFGKYYHMQDTNDYDHTDIMLTACTNGCRYNAEIKKRNYFIEDLSGSTMLEKTKLDYYRQQYRQECTRCLTYFNYYSNGSWISFDMTGRIAYNEGLNRVYIIQLPATTSIDTGIRDKEVIMLSYTNNMYVQDKICLKK